MAILFLLNVAIMLLIGKMRPRKEAYVQKYTEQVNIEPWSKAKPVGLMVVVIVVGIYIYFR